MALFGNSPLHHFLPLPCKLHNQFCHTNRIDKLIVEADNNAEAISSNTVSIKNNADVIEENADLISNNAANLENLTSIPDITALQVKYCKVAGSRLSWLVAHYSIFTLFMKGKFDYYVVL